MRLAATLIATALIGLGLATAVIAAPSRLLIARGSWAGFDRGQSCDAMARPQARSRPSEIQAYAAIAFDRAGPRQGQTFIQLRRPSRPGSSVLLIIGDQPFQLISRGASAWSRDAAQEAAILAALRAAGGMRVTARDSAGRRMTDRYLLDGAPTAIDAAAAACSRPR